MQRNIISGFNHNWIVGYREECVDEVWVRALHSDWVFGLLPHNHAAWAARREGTIAQGQIEQHSLSDLDDHQIICEPGEMVTEYVDHILTIINKETAQ